MMVNHLTTSTEVDGSYGVPYQCCGALLHGHTGLFTKFLDFLNFLCDFTPESVCCACILHKSPFWVMPNNNPKKMMLCMVCIVQAQGNFCLCLARKN